RVPTFSIPEQRFGDAVERVPTFSISEQRFGDAVERVPTFSISEQRFGDAVERVPTFSISEQRFGDAVERVPTFSVLEQCILGTRWKASLLFVSMIFLKTNLQSSAPTCGLTPDKEFPASDPLKASAQPTSSSLHPVRLPSPRPRFFPRQFLEPPHRT